jgi:quercetin dioxygenase-like cupin family protein
MKIGDVRNKISFSALLILDEETSGQNVFDGYLNQLRPYVTKNSKLFFAVGNSSGENVQWVFLPNNTTDLQLYNAIFSGEFGNEEGNLRGENLNIYDYGSSQSPKMWTYLITGLGLGGFGALAIQNVRNKQTFILQVVALYIVLTLTIWLLVPSNKAPTTYTNFTDLITQDDDFIPLAKIAASSLDDFSEKVLQIVKDGRIPYTKLTSGSKAVWNHEGATSSKVYKDDHYTVELVSISPNGQIHPHTHAIDVVVIVLSEGLTYVDANSVEQNAITLSLKTIKAGEQHAIKCGNDAGGYLLSIHENNQDSLFEDL